MTTPADLGPRARLLVEKHAHYIRSFEKSRESFEFYATEHFRMSGVYWGLTAMYLLGRLDEMDGPEILEWVLACAKPDDVAGLQQPDGSFAGDCWGEIDSRFSYCALSCCALLGHLDALDVPQAARYVGACRNFDGGFGCTPGNESHAGQVFCCVGALAIAGALDSVDRDLLCWWLCERQTKSGGLNGRPEKMQDVCYSWWCLSALSILGRLHWIDSAALSRFILYCQDEDGGGISDRPEDVADVYHTFFGIAGLALLGYKGLQAVDPVHALPMAVMEAVRARHAARAVVES